MGEELRDDFSFSSPNITLCEEKPFTEKRCSSPKGKAGFVVEINFVRRHHLFHDIQIDDSDDHLVENVEYHEIILLHFIFKLIHSISMLS